MKITNYPLLLAVFFSVFLQNCSAGVADNHASNSIAESDSLKNKKTLIVYLSRTKNTKAVAEMIKSETTADLVSLELQKPYPEDYQQIVDQVAEENDRGFLPILKTEIENFDQYEVIFIGFPTWGMQLPPPVKSFLNTYNFRDKTVIPFNTNAGYGVGSSFDTVKELAKGSHMLEGFSTKGGKERDGILYVMEGEKEKQVQGEVKRWLKRIGY